MIARVPSRSPIALASAIDGINAIGLELHVFISFRCSDEAVQVRHVCASRCHITGIGEFVTVKLDKGASSESLEVIEVPDGGDVRIVGDSVEYIKVVVARYLGCYGSNHLVMCRRKL
jgi:hypothetical protein